MRWALWYVLMLGMSCYTMCCVCSWRKGTRAVWSAPRTCGCVWGRTTPLDWPACLWRAALWGTCCCMVSHHQIPPSFPQTGTVHSHVSAKLWLLQVLNLILTNLTPRCVPAWMKSIHFRYLILLSAILSFSLSHSSQASPSLGGSWVGVSTALCICVIAGEVTTHVHWSRWSRLTINTGTTWL